MARERVDVPILEGESWVDWVQRTGEAYGQTLTTNEVDFILWDRTDFPFASESRIEEQVHDFFRDQP